MARELTEPGANDQLARESTSLNWAESAARSGCSTASASSAASSRVSAAPAAYAASNATSPRTPRSRVYCSVQYFAYTPAEHCSWARAAWAAPNSRAATTASPPSAQRAANPLIVSTAREWKP